MVAVGLPGSEDWAMQAVTTIGLDIAKSIFQVHGVGADGNVVIRRKLKRRYVIAWLCTCGDGQDLGPAAISFDDLISAQLN
jgi:hypothetical protein